VIHNSALIGGMVPHEHNIFGGLSNCMSWWVLDAIASWIKRLPDVFWHQILEVISLTLPRCLRDSPNDKGLVGVHGARWQSGN
jgi:hypothetical protein